MRRLSLLAVLAWCAAAPAFAHPGHPDPTSGFVAGFTHPFSGLDHLLAMVAVGLWARLAFPAAWSALPITFVLCMSAAFALGAAGGALPYAEAAILASLVVLGAAVALKMRPAIPIAIGLVALFAAAHGFAHGAEFPAGAHALAYCAGFASATALLHLAGIALASVGQPRGAQLAGVAIAAAGVALAAMA